MKRTKMQGRRAAQIKELYVGIIGWAWMAAVVAALYLLVTALFFGSSWWMFFASVAVARVLYRVSLYYVLENERAMRTAAPIQATPPSTSSRLNSCLLIDNTAKAHLPGPQNPGECRLYLAEGCHLYIALTAVSRIIELYGKSGYAQDFLPHIDDSRVPSEIMPCLI
jgi:hypothetical protein